MDSYPRWVAARVFIRPGVAVRSRADTNRLPTKLPTDWLPRIGFPMLEVGDFLFSPTGLTYNLPALLFLGLLLWKRPIWGLLLASLAFARVFLGWIPWSMHMMIATFGLLACRARWMRGLAALLLVFSTYFYLWRFQDVFGWLLGGGMGLLTAGLAGLSSVLLGISRSKMGVE